jgi:sulfur carrier protein ThiS adenylyltransferase
MENDEGNPESAGPYDLETVKTRLHRCRVGIAGAGGLGSNIAMALARAGVGHLLVVDFDRVEESNLNRQAFFLDQIGQLKTRALKENIERAVKGCVVEILNIRLEKGDMASHFANVDVVVEALDAASTKVNFIEEILTKLPGKRLVAASGVAGIGGLDRIRVIDTGDLILVEDPHANSSDEDVVLCPKVGAIAHFQADIVLGILMEVWK